jgi:hypothetical protein
MDPAARESMRQVQFEMLRRLDTIAAQLPNGVLQRLLADAEFYRAWSRGKKDARRTARLAQVRARGPVRRRNV